MEEMERLQRELEIARAEADYYRNLVLLDEHNPASVVALDESQDRLDHLSTADFYALADRSGNVIPVAATPVLPARKKLTERLRYLAMIPINILIAIPVSIVAAVALARLMSSSLMKKGLLEVLVKNTSQSVRITVDQQQNGREEI
ncbi:MAG: hypothetical protein GX153_03750 [Clostridiaceae bacterium]|jgi:hypothetical protein|nr:hypothetical protein [Clostridiaceae bacterium]